MVKRDSLKVRGRMEGGLELTKLLCTLMAP